MKIKQFEIPGLSQYSYVVSPEGQAVVIDPMRDVNRYTDYAKEQDLAIRYVTETHIHVDFASGAPGYSYFRLVSAHFGNPHYIYRRRSEKERVMELKTLEHHLGKNQRISARTL